jgi:hypothetical protein
MIVIKQEVSYVQVFWNIPGNNYNNWELSQFSLYDVTPTLQFFYICLQFLLSCTYLYIIKVSNQNGGVFHAIHSGR